MAGAAGGSGTEEKGDIRAQGGGDFVQAGGTELGIVKLVERKQGGGGIAAAATEAGPGGDVFLQGDGEIAGDSGGAFVGSNGLHHEVRLIIGDAGLIAMKGKP